MAICNAPVSLCAFNVNVEGSYIKLVDVVIVFVELPYKIKFGLKVVKPVPPRTIDNVPVETLDALMLVN